MRIMESVTKMFRLFNEEMDKDTGLVKANEHPSIKVVADPEHDTIKIIGTGGSVSIYRREAESLASTILVAEEWLQTQNGGRDE